MSTENNEKNPFVKSEPSVKNEPADMPTSSILGSDLSSTTPNSALSSAKKVREDK